MCGAAVQLLEWSIENAPTADEYEEAIGKLDLQLTYLWRVHGVDYYGGKEFADPSQTEARAKTCRMLRGQRPEEGEQAPEAEGALSPEKGLRTARAGQRCVIRNRGRKTKDPAMALQSWKCKQG